MTLRWLLATIGLSLAPGLAAAQQAAPPTPASQNTGGPLTIQRLQTPFVVEPAVKITDMDGYTGVLAGGSAGWLLEKTLFIGAAGYGLANPSDGDRLGYGGLVVEWPTAIVPDRVRFGVRGLVGAGRATLGTEVSRPAFRFGGRQAVAPRRLRLRDDFFLAEPEAALRVRLLRHVGVRASGGYRFTGATRARDNRLDGVTGTVGLQIGGW